MAAPTVTYTAKTLTTTITVEATLATAPAIYGAMGAWFANTGTPVWGGVYGKAAAA